MDVLERLCSCDGGAIITKQDIEDLRALRRALTAAEEARDEAEKRARVAGNRGDRATAAAAEIGNVLDIIERNIGATKYETMFAAEQDIRDLIRVGRENARACYGVAIPQLVTAMQEIRRLQDEVTRVGARRDEAVEAAGTYEASWSAAEARATAAESALATERAFRTALHRCVAAVGRDAVADDETPATLAEFVVQEVSGLRDETLRAVQDVICLRDKAINERDAERTRADRAEKDRDEALDTARTAEADAQAWQTRATSAEKERNEARTERDVAQAKVCTCTFGPNGEQCVNCARVSDIIRRHVTLTAERDALRAQLSDPTAFWSSRTPAEAWALLQAAPRVAGAWDPPQRDGEGAARPNMSGQCLAVVYGRRNGGGDDRKWEIWDRNMVTRNGVASSLREAMAAADAALIAAGWVLVQEGE